MQRNHLLLILLAIVLLPLTLRAQDGLAINQAFDGRFRSNTRAVETIIKGSQLKPFNLEVYHCLNLRAATREEVKDIEKWVQKDAAKATSSEVSYRAGVLYYGFYVLPKKGGNNRYLIYVNRNSRISLLYLEGTADATMVRALIDADHTLIVTPLIPMSIDALEAADMPEEINDAWEINIIF